MDAQQYITLHGWYTQGLSLGQIDVDAYKQAVAALAAAFTTEKEEDEDERLHSELDGSGAAADAVSASV